METQVSIVTLYLLVVPRLQACPPHSEKVSEVIAYAFPLQLHSCQHSPRQGGSDLPATKEKLQGEKILFFSKCLSEMHGRREEF